MKRILLLLYLCPLFISAQEIYDEHKFAEMLLSSRSRSEPAMRSDPLPPLQLISTHVYDDLADLLIAKYYYEFDDTYVMKRQKIGYSGETELYKINTTYTYEPRKYYWIEQIDSIFEQGRYTSKSKYVRTYNEEAYLTEYKEYESAYDSPWGNALQTYSAVEFNDQNMPTVFIDKMLAVDPNDALTIEPIIRKWEVKYGKYMMVEEMTGYVQVVDKWIPEIKYIVSYHEMLFQRTMEIFTMVDNEWSLKIGEVITDLDGRGNKDKYQKKDEKDELIQSYIFNQFYDEGTTHNQSITNAQSPEIYIDNSTRTLTIDLKEAEKGNVTVVSAAGIPVFSQAVNQLMSQLSLANLKAGYYIVCVRTAGQNKSQAVVLN